MPSLPSIVPSGGGGGGGDSEDEAHGAAAAASGDGRSDLLAAIRNTKKNKALLKSATERKKEKKEAKEAAPATSSGVVDFQSEMAMKIQKRRQAIAGTDKPAAATAAPELERRGSTVSARPDGLMGSVMDAISKTAKPAAAVEEEKEWSDHPGDDSD